MACYFGHFFPHLAMLFSSFVHSLHCIAPGIQQPVRCLILPGGGGGWRCYIPVHVQYRSISFPLPSEGLVWLCLLLCSKYQSSEYRVSPFHRYLAKAITAHSPRPRRLTRSKRLTAGEISNTLETSRQSPRESQNLTRLLLLV